MRRITRSAYSWTAACAAAALGIAGALYAQTAPPPTKPAPRLSVEFNDDEQLTLKGAVVKMAGLSPAAEALARETARVKASQSYVVHPAIWKIGDADTVIYLFGTVHSLPPGFRWRNPVLEGAIANADSLLLETTDNDAEDVDFLAGLPKDETLPPLLERVSHRYRAKLAAFQGDLPDDAVKELDHMPSWIAAMSLSYIRDLLAGDMPGPGADDWLEQHFRAQNKRVEAIEDGAGVIANLNAVPERAQRLMIEAAIAAPDPTHEELDATAHAWARGEVGPDSPLMINPGDLDPSAALNDPLLAQRNTAWVVRLGELIRTRPGTIFFAAGAGHFVGTGSVIDLLQKKGVRVERVQ